MADALLLQSWTVTLRHLSACRYYLPETLASREAEACERQLDHFLHNREYGLALEEAEALGTLCLAPPEYWRELQFAAENMGLAKEGARYAARHKS